MGLGFRGLGFRVHRAGVLRKGRLGDGFKFQVDG